MPSRSTYPLIRTIGKQLMLPHRHPLLELINEKTTRRKSLPPMLSPHSHHHRHITNLQNTNTMHRRHRMNPLKSNSFLRNLTQHILS